MRNLLIIPALSTIAFGQLNSERLSEESVLSRIAELRAPDVAWRRIQWKSCLLEGIQESRESNKPILLWVFIDRPVDDARC